MLAIAARAVAVDSEERNACGYKIEILFIKVCESSEEIKVLIHFLRGKSIWVK